MEKMTNVKAINYVLANAELPTDVKEKLEKMREQFVKKNSAERKPTATQVENDRLKDLIVDFLVATGKSFTVTDLIKASPDLADLTNQKVSRLANDLVDENRITKFSEKRKTYFKA